MQSIVIYTYIPNCIHISVTKHVCILVPNTFLDIASNDTTAYWEPRLCEVSNICEVM